jgi:hypothetical protein
MLPLQPVFTAVIAAMFVVTIVAKANVEKMKRPIGPTQIYIEPNDFIGSALGNIWRTIDMTFATELLDTFTLSRLAGANKLAAANQLVDRYLHFFKDAEIGSDLIDEIELPYPKRLLVEAFCHVIATEDRTQIRTLLVKAAITLAQYQGNLGERIRLRPVTPNGRPQRAGTNWQERRLQIALFAAAEDRVRLTETFSRQLH